jgi:formylglycine-generating enzyme required for sulfatase activity
MFAKKIMLSVLSLSLVSFGAIASTSCMKIKSSFSFERISEGSFSMGRIDSKYDSLDEEKLDQGIAVKISKSFDIMNKEVTQLQWFQVMNNNPATFSTPEYCEDHIFIGEQGLCPNNPVESVSWDDVQKYIAKLNNSHEGKFRLPTDAEWEYAARGKMTTTYSFGNDETDLESFAWFMDNSENTTHLVGQKFANPNGLYDVHGNVWEWVQDNYSETVQGGVDPQGPSIQDEELGRVIRGGSWLQPVTYMDSIFRTYMRQARRNYAVGFRLVRTL